MNVIERRMDFRMDNDGEERGEEDLFSEPIVRRRLGELFIEAELTEANLEDEEVESWGVYLQGKEKTLLGLFWDQELARMFLGTINGSKLLEKVKKIV
jgi:hypothetical protein